MQHRTTGRTSEPWRPSRPFT